MRIHVTGILTLVLSLGSLVSSSADAKPPARPTADAHRSTAGKFDSGATGKLKQMLESAEHRVHNAVYVPAQAKRFLHDGADPNVANSGGTTVVHFAATEGDLETLKLSLKLGGKPNAKDHLGNTPLHNAACSGDVKAMTLLLAAGAQINAKSQQGMTPIDMAYRLGQRDAEKFLRARGGQITLGVKKLTPDPKGRPLH